MVNPIQGRRQVSTIPLHSSLAQRIEHLRTGRSASREHVSSKCIRPPWPKNGLASGSELRRTLHVSDSEIPREAEEKTTCRKRTQDP